MEDKLMAIEKVLYQSDPAAIGKSTQNPNTNEYSAEAASILIALNEANSVKDLSNKAKQIFDRQFCASYSKSILEHACQEIFELR